MIHAQSALALVGVALTLCSVVAGGWAVSRAAAIKSTLDTVIVGNNELRTLNDELRAELAAEKALRVEDKAQARAEIARLEGQMQLLTGHLGEQIAAAVVRALPVSRLEHLMRVESRDFTTGDLTIEELPDPLSASPPTT